jgi:hypothetical protein
MRRMPPRERPRRGAWRGSRWASALGAACLIAVAVSLTLPSPASAYLCDGPRPASPLPHPELISPSDYVAPNDTECRVPDSPSPAKRVKKRGSMSGLTVFVLAVAAVLLIPIGARGIPSSVDPYADERLFK